VIDDIEQSGQDARTTVGPIEGVIDVSEVRVTQPRIDFDTLQRQFTNVGLRQNPLIPAPNEAPEIDQDALNIVNQSRDAMQASLMNATQYSPDEAAEAQRLGAPLNLNYDLVLRNKDQVKHAAIMRDIASRDLMRNDPILARQLENLDFAAIAYDDLDNLSQNGSIFRDIASAIGGRPWEMQDIPREIVRGYLRGEAVAERGRVGTQIMLEGETAATAEQVRQLRESMMQLEQFGESGFLSLGAEMVAQNVAGIREVAATTLTGAAIGTGIFPGVGTMGGAYGGFQAGSFLTTARMEAGNAYLDMIEAGVNEDDAKYAAIGTGLVNGLIEVAFQKFAAAPFKGIANKLLRNQINQTLVRPTTRKALADAAKSYVTTVAGEAGEEGLQQLTNIVNRNVARTMSGMDPDVTASEAGAEIVDSFIAGAMGSALLGGIGPGANVYNEISIANASVRQAVFFENLSKNAADSKVRRRNVEAYGRTLARQAASVNAETTYFRGDVARDILHQNAITRQQLDQIVPGLFDRIQETATTGGFVNMNTADFGARLAGTPLGNQLLQHLTLDPKLKSPAELVQYESQKLAMIEDAKRILEEKKTTEAAFVDDAVAFEKRILAQIEEAGKTLETPLTKTQAQAAAKVYQAMYVNLAARAGKTVTQLEQEIGSPLQIRGAQAVAAPLEQAARIDADYMAAVERGDMATAQRMVDEAARIVGLPPRSGYEQIASELNKKLPSITPGFVRMWRGNRPGQIDVGNRSFTNDLAGIALPFRSLYGGTISFVDVPEEVANASVVAGAVAPNAEFSLPQQYADAAQQVSLITRDESGNVVPLSRRFDITSPRIFEQAVVPAAFYSALGRAIDGIDIKSASASGWKERIKGLVNKGDIKQDELTWSGLEDWLSLPREGKITKDEVAEFLKNNGVRVEQIVPRQPKYAQYTLPGGTNYREVLLTLTPSELTGTIEELPNGRFRVDYPGMRSVVVDTREDAESELEESRLAMGDKSGVLFRSEHWTQPNVVAHIRMNDRVDADGKRVLFVEEIQSDWAQAGRKKGFAGVTRLATESDVRSIMVDVFGQEQGNELTDIYGWDTLATVVNDPQNAGDLIADAGWTEQQADKFVRLAAQRKVGVTGIAVAPFVARQQFAVFKGDKEVTRKNKEGKEVKQRYSSMKAAEAAAAKVGGEARDIGMQADTEGWVNLALKQIVLEAVNGGYDRVAFINGEQSKDRYDLSKQVSEVAYNIDRKTLFAYDMDGVAVLAQEDVNEQDIADYIGKEATERLLNAPKQTSNSGTMQRLKGEDLKVGGAGMVAFYDKIVPAATSKLLEKLDGGKLGEIRLPYMLPKQMEADADRLGMTQADILEVAGEEDAYAQNQSGFDVTDALREKIASGLPLFQSMPGRGPARGGIDVTTLLITLGKSADITTFGHEAAHAYFEILGRLAAAPNAPEFFRNDMDILLRFGKIAGDTPEARLATWNATTLDGRRKLHEAFAYNFEIYLFEGKSPSVEMQGLFDRFALWLKRVYKSLRDDLNAIYRREFGEDLPVLTDEVREVMDRMLASDEQIKRQREVQGMKPLLTGRLDGMSDADWAEYQLLSEQDLNAAIQKLTEASLKDMQWLSNARSRVIKSLQAQHAKLRKEMRERIATEVAAQPEYRTLKYLRTGTMQAVDGTEVQAEGVTKLNAARVDEIANATTMAQMFDTRSIPNGITVKDGQDPDVVAEMFGFASGSDMILRISAAKPLKEAIDAQLDARMEAEYGEMFTPAEVEKQVNKALHNEVRARLVATELKWLSKSTQPIRVMLEAARQVARETIGRTTVGDLKPAQFIAAEARLAKEAAGLIETPMDAESAARSAYTRTYNRQKAAGATEEAAVASATYEATTAASKATERLAAFRERYGDGDRERIMVQAKRRQLLQNQLASAAIETQEEIDKAIKGFRKFFKADAKIAESRDLAMVMAARAILASRGIGRSDKAPAAYVEQLQANNPGLYAELAPIIMQAGVGDYRKMTVSEFRVLAESVEALWSRARRDRQIQVGEQKVELDLVVSELIAAMSKIKRPAVQQGVREAVGFKDVAKRQAMEVRAANRRVESWSDALDAADQKRPFTTYLWQPVKDAVVRFRQIRNDKVKKLYELVMQLDIPKNSIDAPELDYTFGRGNAGAGKAELLGAMLHAGNESNYRKLLLGRQWATLDEAGNMDDSRWERFVARMFAQGVLTKGDFDFLQAVWDLNEEIKPLLQKAHYDLEGYYFKEVQATPVVTPFGTYRGGYVPAATDRFMVADAVQRAGMQELEQDWRFSLPSTGMGMTKARVESYTKPLALDIRLIVTHVDAALRFAIIQPAVVDALKILKNRSFAAEIDKIDPTAITAMLLPWLNRSAHQTVSQPGRFKSVDAFWRGVRTRTGMSIMFANLRNAFQQITGLFPSAVKVSPVYLKNAVTTYLGDPRGTANMIAATDPFMDQRMRDQVYEMQEQMNDLLLNPSKFEKVQAWNKQHAYFIQTAFQNQVDIITWLGAYNQSLAESGVGVSEEKARKQAIRDAGAAVRLTQGSIMPEDISAFEAGTPFYRTFTQFAGYFNGIANLNATEMVKTVRTMGFRGGKGKLLYIYMLGFAMPAIVSDAIVRSMGGGWDDDDEDGYLDVFMDWFFGSQIRMGAAFIPFGSTALQAITTPFDNKPYNDRMNNSPSIQALESATIGTGKAIVNVVDEDKELTGKNVRDVLTAVSLATGIPVSVLGRPAGYLVDVYRGEIEPEGPIDFTLGILTGTTAPSTRR